jgi:hypothetical protein
MSVKSGAHVVAATAPPHAIIAQPCMLFSPNVKCAIHERVGIFNSKCKKCSAPKDAHPVLESTCKDCGNDSDYHNQVEKVATLNETEVCIFFLLYIYIYIYLFLLS